MNIEYHEARCMRILAIETSCDETAIAILQGTGNDIAIEVSLVRSQIDIHAAYGGVIPEVAAREHLEMISSMLARTARADGEGIDAIAVTAGPGLAPALRVGVEVAKTLAWAWKKPLIPVCHLEGHIYASWISSKPPQFPVLALIVSGGHTELVLMHDHGNFERLGETLDDAAGEAFDKVAKMFGLPYPGGPAIAALAERGDSKVFHFPRPMLDRDDAMFSFSGLKTAVLYELRKNDARIHDETFRSNIAASFQEAIVETLVEKTMRAAGKLAPKSIVLAGGVAANTVLRDRLKEAGEHRGIPVYVPALQHTLDNAAMIAVAGYYRAQHGENAVDPLTLVVNPNQDI